MENIPELSFSVLTLPHSNAEVERVFSQVNIVKNKLRNGMKINTLSAILRVRFVHCRVEKCCFSYNIPFSVLQHVGMKAAYTPMKPTEISELAGEEINRGEGGGGCLFLLVSLFHYSVSQYE